MYVYGFKHDMEKYSIGYSGNGMADMVQLVASNSDQDLADLAESKIMIYPQDILLDDDPRFMTSGGVDLLHNSFDCDYGCIINLQDYTLDYYQGLQIEPAYKNDWNRNDFYSCKLIRKYPFEKVRSDPAFILQEMNRLDRSSLRKENPVLTCLALSGQD